MGIEGISEELIERAKACESSEELIALAQEQGIDLSDEIFNGVVGGGEWICTTACHQSCC